MAKKKTDTATYADAMPLLNAGPPGRADKFPLQVCLSAQHAMEQTGCPAAVALAQGALESGFFTKMPPNSYNCLGIKAVAGQPSISVETEEWSARLQRKVTTTASFRVFDNYDEAFLAHGKLLTDTSGPYRHYIQFMSDPYKWVRAFASTYASDPDYSTLVLEIMDEWHLADFNVQPAADDQSQ